MMYGDYEVVKESDGTFSAKLDCNGYKVCNCKTEIEVQNAMAALDIAYQNGFEAGAECQKKMIRQKLGI